MKITTQKLPQSRIEASIVVEAAEFAAYEDKAFKKIQEEVTIDGFRKGSATKTVIQAKYGQSIFLEEMAELAMRDAYIQMLSETKAVPVTEPQVSITKLAPGNDFELTLTITTIPEIKLPDIHAVAKKQIATIADDGEVSDQEVTDVLEELAKNRAHAHTHDENCDHDHADEAQTDAAQADAAATTPTPALDDAFAQSFGPQFKTLDDIKKVVKENMQQEKIYKTKEKRRTAVMEALVAESTSEIPDVMIDQETNRMLEQMKYDITRFGSKWEDYLKETNKTEADLKANWKDDATKRIMSQLIVGEIALAHQCVPSDEEVEVELVKLLASVQDADEASAKAYLRQALTNEKVLTMLGA